jgi:hypothetical protein
MSNHSLWTKTSFNSVDAEPGDTLLDELFQIVNVSCQYDLVITIIYNPLNYSKATKNKSHVKQDGMFFHISNGKKIRFILDKNKIINIDLKHDNLRLKLY